MANGRLYASYESHDVPICLGGKTPPVSFYDYIWKKKIGSI